MSALRGIRLVALDLDGTLLPSNKRLTPRAVSVAEALRERGIHVVISTGRGWTHVSRYARQLGAAGPHVCLEGTFVARACDDGGPPQVLSSKSLPPAVIAAAHACAEGLDVGWFACGDDLRTRASAHLKERLDQVRIWDPHVEVLERIRDEDRTGHILHLVGWAPDLARVHERLLALRLPGTELFRAPFWDGLDQIAVRPAGSGKHRGLEIVRDALRIAPEETLAAGDWLNDLEMLGEAGVAVCPANAIGEVKAIADHVLPGTSDDDAVPKFLEDALRGI
ncbi:MAG: HMP-PP phosphatase [Planctomycetes bacterium]|nr:HMP-PP phosphatase [Planctomycetota bacterium]